MARREVIQYFDDIDNTPLTEDTVNTIRFGLNGTEYVLDLSAENAAAFTELLEPYIASAHKVPTTVGRTKKSSATSGLDSRPIREWARKNGYKVSSRGKLSQEIIDTYLAMQAK